MLRKAATTPRRRRARRACRRSRLRAAAQALHAQCRRRHRRADRARRHTVPAVGRLFWAFRFMVGIGFFFIALFAARLLAARQAQAGSPRGFLWLAALEPAAAVDLVRTRLVRRRIRPPALGDRGRAADLPGRLLGLRPNVWFSPARLRRLLLRARGGRRLSDGAHVAGAGSGPGRRAPVSPAASRAAERSGRRDDVALFDYRTCGSSGGRSSASC